jgi:hypothetical protein
MFNNFFIENSFKSKLKTTWEFGHALGIVGKLSKSRIQRIWFEILLT